MSKGMPRDGVWRKANRSSQGGACVEVRGHVDGGVDVRDSKSPDGPHLSFADNTWASFVAGVKAGQFDL